MEPVHDRDGTVVGLQDFRLDKIALNPGNSIFKLRLNPAWKRFFQIRFWQRHNLGDHLAPVSPFDDEQRINQVGRGQTRLPYHAAKCLMLPQPPEPLYWEGHRITFWGDSSRTPRGRAQKSCRPICHPASRRDGGYVFGPSDRWHLIRSYPLRSSRSGPT